MALEFSWNADKAESNYAKHGVSFKEASTAFGDPLSLTIGDPLHSEDETRFVLIGHTFAGRLVVVVHSERSGGIRIITAREATRRERREYERIE